MKARKMTLWKQQHTKKICGVNQTEFERVYFVSASEHSLDLVIFFDPIFVFFIIASRAF